MYKKRQGTSAVHGHLYETKLLSLILFRAQHDNNIREFNLATNIADIGVFDDICFKVKINDDGPPIVAFTQAKHSKSTIGTLNKKSNLVKYFNSYMKIKNKFDPTSKDVIFNAHFNKTKCYFVVYTIAQGDSNYHTVENPSILNNLIATGPVISQPLYSEKNVQFIAKIITATLLAESFAKFLYDKYENQCIALRALTNVITRYHVILAKVVVDVTEILNAEQRTCTFRDDFFKTTDAFLTMFRDHLYLEILKKQNVDKTTQQKLLSDFLTQPSEDTLRPVIGKIILYDDGQFEFVQKRTSLVLREELRQIYLPPSVVKLAIKQSALNILQSPDAGFMVPSTFGNIDLKATNINNLTVKMGDMLNTAVPIVTSEDKIIKLVTIEETKPDRIRVLNRNLGSTVGNILIHDEENGYFKFIENDALLKPNAKALLRHLNGHYQNLKEYRINVKTVQFPKLTYDFVDESLTRDFLSKLVLYTDQASQSEVECILKELIQSQQIRSTQNFRIKSEAIFLKYHDKIQAWWISASEDAPYLTKTCNIYKETVDGIVNNPLMTITSMMYMNKIKPYTYKFDEVAIKSLSSSLNIFTKSKVVGELPALIIVSDSARLTVTKITNLLANKYIILDLHYVLEILPDDYYALISELESDNVEDTFIVVCDLDNFAISTESYRIHEKLKKVVGVLDKKKKIIITNENVFKTISIYFRCINKPAVYDTNNLVDFSPESQKNILDNCQVLFQGQKVNLNCLVDDNSIMIIKGKVLNKIIFNKIVTIGDSLADQNYENIKHLFVNRRLSRGPTTIEMQTLHNVKGDVVLLTGKPGMGKSTLLTHLSLKTKERNKRLWVIKINLLDYSGELRHLQKNKAIDILKIIKFMCLILLKIKKQLRELSLNLENLTITLNKSDGEIYIDEFSGDQWSKFELQMFVHFYNKGHVVFLFDGFDEICPHYKETVITLVNILREDTQKHKVDWSKWLPWPQVWITSRAYNELQSVLQNHFSIPYELENFSLHQLGIYLEKFWRSNLIFSHFNKKIIDRIGLFLDNTSSEKLVSNFTLSSSLGRVHSSFISYLINNFPEIDGTERWFHLYRTIIFLWQYVPDMTDTAYNNYEVECPLLTCLVANYFVKYLRHPDENNGTNSFNINASTVYKWLIEAVIEKHYRDKKKMDLNITYNIMDYETKLPAYIEVHKKIAAYVVFQNDIRNIFDRIQLSEIELFINTIKKGEEVTGLTCSVFKNIPQFLQMTFAQYLAAEYLFDLLKRENIKCRRKRKLLTSVLYNQLDSFCVWLNHKLETNEHFFFQLFELPDCNQQLEDIDVTMISTL